MESALLTLIGTTILAYGPAYVANMAPPLGKFWKLPGAEPIDAKHLGTHKTYRGLAVGVIGGALAAGALWLLGWTWFGQQTWLMAVATGALVGLAAMVGDAVKSGIKRWFGIKAGQPFIPWDQIDFILGASLVMLPLGVVTWQVALTALIITPLLHVIVNIGAYLAGLKEVWW